MATNSQIVPSKNALRALRKLALGGSTVVGAVGSVSGLACVSYDIRQRICLAESIVETKRVLHSQSISNPNRKAHMAAIFEMYEKGQGKEGDESWQDFSRRARKHSAQAKYNNERELVDAVTKEDVVHCAKVANKSTSPKFSNKILHNSMSRPMFASIPPDHPLERSRIVLKETAPLRWDQNSSTAQRIIEATQKPHKVDSHTVYGRPRESRNISPVQKIITATQRQHKLTSEVVFGQPNERKDETLPELASCIQQWLVPTDGKRQGAPSMIPSRRSNTPGQTGRSYESARSYSSFPVKVQDDLDYPRMCLSTAEHRYDDAFFPNDDKRPGMADHGRDFDLMQLGPGPTTETVLEKRRSQENVQAQPGTLNYDPQRKISDVQSELTTLMDSIIWKPKISREVRDISAFYVPSTDLAPTTKSDTLCEPSAVLKRLFAIIPLVTHKEGIVAARNLTKDAFEIYAEGGRPEDYRAIDQLHLEFGRKLQLYSSIQPMRQLIHYLFNTGLDDDCRRAGRLLFHCDVDSVPTDDHASSVVTYRYERTAMSYIAWLCSTTVSNSSLVHEFRKVLEAAYRQGASPSEALFSPVLQRFLEQRDMKYLRNVFDEMKAAHGIEAGALTRTILLLGYARANDWAQVVTEFETMHKDGLSRKEPIGYAVMFDEVFRQYAASEPVEKTHDFLVNAICYWGLVPITKVSATAVQAYIRHRRYDLVKEWVEATRYMFPHVENSGNRFAATLAKTWGEIGASCEEIEEACLSIIGRGDMVSGRFRAVVQEALAGYLARKLHATDSEGSAPDDHSGQTEHSDDLPAQLKSAFALIIKDAGESGIVKQSRVADILAQSKAALRLRDLFGEKPSISAPDVELAPRLDRPFRRQTDRRKSPTQDLSTPIPEVLRREELPDIQTIISLVSAYYSRQSKLKQPVSHDILKMTCCQLSMMRRHHDILRIVSHIYNDPAVQGPNGVMFDLDIIQPWMEAAYHLKSPVACKQIFNAILEKGLAIRLTQQFMLLVRMASQKAFGTKFSSGNPHLAKQVVELNYLEKRLYDRFYIQRKNADPKKGRYHDGKLSLRIVDAVEPGGRSRKEDDSVAI